ncbi:MAG: T9SS type A sorting domain-containing protein [Bacteroidia bacterium]
MKLKNTFLIAVLILLSTLTKAQLTGFSYVQSISVSNTSTVSAVNYQLSLTINTQTLIAASQMLPTGADIRFGKTCNGAILYNYWIETGINTPTTTVWVKIDSIPAGGNRTFFMFYGNPSATAVSSIPLVFISGGSATDTVSGGTSGGTALSQRGFRFSPNMDVLVTSFGKKEPTGTTRYVTLFDNTSTSIITQQQVSGPAATYTYAPLSNPLWLTSGTQYILELFQGSSDGYYYQTSSQINPLLTYYDMRFCNSCTQNTFPTSVLSGYHYGYPDLLFYYKNVISPTPTYTLMGNAQPTINAVSDSTTLCMGNTTTLTASGASSYTWNTSATTSTISITPTVTTTYSVTGTDANGCTNMTTITQTVITCGTGINQLTSSNEQITIYPNPASQLVNLKISEFDNLKMNSVEIYNTIGECVHRQIVSSANCQIDVSNLAEGVYNLQITTSSAERSEYMNTKIIILKSK